MFFAEEEYIKVEAATLDNHHFNSKQREFIELMESRYVIAGPGAGKTTALSAKIVLLLLNLLRKNSNEGICVITKTNVAVDEINRILKNVGLSNLKHPHFIGTLHNFFNTYLATPYIQKELNPKFIRFGREKDFLPILREIVTRHSYFKRWKEEGAREAVAKRINDSNLFFDSSTGKFILENSTNWEKFDTHSSHMLTVKLNLKKAGYFSFDDIILFSEAALSNAKLISMLRKRFSHVFVDEFQDTDKRSMGLVNKIFNTTGNIVQYIGDPNQTLDFDGEMPHVDPSKVFELNICNRFGEEIAKQLPYIVNDVNIECIDKKRSFKPLLLIYMSKGKLIEEYKNLFKLYLKDAEFAGDKRLDKILGIQNDTINDFGPNVGTGSRMRIKRTESYTSQILFSIIDLFMDKIPGARNKDFGLVTLLNNHPTYKALKICLARSIKSQKLEVDELVKHINQILIDNDGQKINKSNGVFRKVSALIEIQSNHNKPKLLADENDTFTYGTIHSVKGETHRSVLLIDSENDNKPKIHTRLLKSCICEWEEDLSQYWVERNLLYVAMSRPTYLFTFAMDRNFITGEEIEMFRLKGWDIHFTDEVKLDFM
ncbi:UvrD-helicase domain-containing protein [Paenibacillus sp. Y412MC10]|uniref:UvrD-helicase domain-containing protein n=1 Tax=Geobacillus sp. (strain Y412MC10) TaxID=481743 RepID=UPI0011AB63A5|nr:UvrD-helicase domain-containing protein [Paenibacillus sp. Y412MC10]